MNTIDHRTCPVCNRTRGIRMSPSPPATMCDECEAKEAAAKVPVPVPNNYGPGQTRRPTPELPAAKKEPAAKATAAPATPRKATARTTGPKRPAQ